MNSPAVNPVALSEDDYLAWYPCSVSRWVAIGSYAAECGVPRRQLRVRRRHLREAKWTDCPVPRPHPVDELGDPPDNCTCWQIEEGWFTECDSAHPDAIPVWRVEERPWRFRWWIRRRIQHLFYRNTDLMRRSPCIWGGKVDRRANWLDRVLIGYRGTYLYCRSNWLGKQEGELRWCGVCKATTPHSLDRFGSWCQADKHNDDLEAAPFAAEVEA